MKCIYSFSLFICLLFGAALSAASNNGIKISRAFNHPNGSWQKAPHFSPGYGMILTNGDEQQLTLDFEHSDSQVYIVNGNAGLIIIGVARGNWRKAPGQPYNPAGLFGIYMHYQHDFGYEEDGGNVNDAFVRSGGKNKGYVFHYDTGAVLPLKDKANVAGVSFHWGDADGIPHRLGSHPDFIADMQALIAASPAQLGRQTPADLLSLTPVLNDENIGEDGPERPPFPPIGYPPDNGNGGGNGNGNGNGGSDGGGKDTGVPPSDQGGDDAGAGAGWLSQDGGDDEPVPPKNLPGKKLIDKIMQRGAKDSPDDKDSGGGNDEAPPEDDPPIQEFPDMNVWNNLRMPSDFLFTSAPGHTGPLGGNT